MVSLAFSFCLAGGIYFSVRILWSRSASLIRMTRMSLAIARNIFLRFSAWTSTLSAEQLNCPSLVTPSTSSSTSSPNSCRISSDVITVSSTTSWRRPATIVSLSSSRSARIMATHRGCMIQGSPDFLTWPLWALLAILKAFSIMVISVEG